MKGTDSKKEKAPTPWERGLYLRAGDRARTGDVQLGKLAFYQLNYARVWIKVEALLAVGYRPQANVMGANL